MEIKVVIVMAHLFKSPRPAYAFMHIHPLWRQQHFVVSAKNYVVGDRAKM